MTKTGLLLKFVCFCYRKKVKDVQKTKEEVELEK